MPDTLQIPEPIFSVAEFSTAMKGLVEGAFRRIKIRGEIAGLKLHSSGTYYFDLKESLGGKDFVLACVIWRETKLDLKPEEGLEVILTGRATTYSGRSSYQLSVEAIEIAGVGALAKLIEERRKKLAAEGLFDASRKRPVPRFPRIIGVVSSPTGAVIMDIIHRISERWPARIILWPSAVQGEGAEASVAAGIAGLNALAHGDRPDVIIVARGGGSLQDLMPFNAEEVVRAAAASHVPLISAIGHETDTTLLDFAADLRAPTPTAAAELATPERREILALLAASSARMMHAASRVMETCALRLKSAFARTKSPADMIAELVQRLDNKSERLALAARHRLDSLESRLAHACRVMESLSFARVLDRGYAIAWNGSAPVRSAAELAKLKPAEIQLRDGKVSVRPDSPRPSGREPDLFDNI